ncbi:EF-hand domain-containing family member B [Drosophila sechellia]|uniref:GM24736 n=1 Tax=Drosophila sechellia TaxID=7238 RepID=B4HEG5_DROSE|nr:EF-hand domain-containing family member B [Drosophila sechellia]EDW41119.1 GM24736 [Drosophila sechellia]
MANKGHFIDRNADIPTAGLSTSGLDGAEGVKDCLSISNPEELAESLVRRNYGQIVEKSQNFPAGSVLPSSSIRDLLTSELQKSRFMSFREKFYEEMYFKKATLGEVKKTYSKPEDVTNTSQTFGSPSSPSQNECLYDVILPAKSAEQVNKEYEAFHDKYIISHNHYFPSEQVNRRYAQPFDRKSPCGDIHTQGDFGLKVKRCLEEGENHLKVIGKAQVDFMDRNEAPLGMRNKKFTCAVPDITFGVPLRSNGDVKMLLNNIEPCDKTNRLLDAIRYLNKKRHSLRNPLEFHKYVLNSVLERSDTDGTGHLPLARILEIFRSFHIRLDAQKIRLALSNFRMIVDEGCATERVNYEDFFRLLSIQNSLPKTGNLTNVSDVSCLDTTYRLLCADLQNKSKDDTGAIKQNLEGNKTTAKDLLTPDLAILRGLTHSDFTCLRPKAEIERIFRSLVTTDKFEAIWQSLMTKFKDQNEMASVSQFRTEMHNKLEAIST